MSSGDASILEDHWRCRRTLTVRVRNGGQVSYTTHPLRPTVRNDGSFTTRIRSTKALRLYVSLVVDGVHVRSNAVLVRAAR